MPRHIRQTIQDRIVGPINIENGQNPPGNSRTAKRLSELAQAVITNGQRDANGALTPAWREYTTFLLTGFVQGAAADANDLNRLLPEADPTGDTPERALERCYLVANGMCGTGTGSGILNQGIPTVHLDE
ncbi:MAG TPA: hypothetical protein VGC87_01615 [Pyrinomonadaceae bacterium]|jgi:hypothetical protein